MFKGGRVLGIVPARKGSKRLRNKNILELKEKPLLCWSIEAGLNCEEVDLVVVSTDCDVIREHALRCGADAVVMRPSYLAEDCASSMDVVDHVLRSNVGEKFDWLVLLQPTSPLRHSEHLSEAFRLVRETGASGTISICRTSHPVEWTGRLRSNNSMDQFFEDAQLEINSHELEPRYRINGAIYIISVGSFLKKKTFFGQPGMVGYVMDRRDSVDIDTEHDFEEASFLMSRREQVEKLGPTSTQEST